MKPAFKIFAKRIDPGTGSPIARLQFEAEGFLIENVSNPVDVILRPGETLELAFDGAHVHVSVKPVES